MSIFNDFFEPFRRRYKPFGPNTDIPPDILDDLYNDSLGEGHRKGSESCGRHGTFFDNPMDFMSEFEEMFNNFFRGFPVMAFPLPNENEIPSLPENEEVYDSNSTLQERMLNDKTPDKHNPRSISQNIEPGIGPSQTNVASSSMEDANDGPTTSKNENIEPGIGPSQTNVPSSSIEHANDGPTTSKNKVMRERERCCEYFQEQVENKFIQKLQINKDDIKNPSVGPIPEKLNDAGTVTSIALGAATGTTLALSIGSFGICSFVGAAIGLVTFTVMKRNKNKKKSSARKLNSKVEIYLHSMLNCIFMDVARELSRIFEYQVVELKDDTQIDTLADCAVDLMLQLNEGDKFNRNTLLKKVLQDGEIKKRELLTKTEDKWSAPDVFRKPGLRKIFLEKNGAGFKYFVRSTGDSKKKKDACDAARYGYRGQFLEMKWDGEEEEDEKVSEKWHRKLFNFFVCKPKTETRTHDDSCDCKESCEEFSSHEYCTISHQYFCESDIDSQYRDSLHPNRTYVPMHILIQCPNVLDSFIQFQEEKPSLANFLKKTLGLPEYHCVHPVYRPHSSRKVLNLGNSDLTGSDFSHSDFTNSVLEHCNFTEVVMLFAELAGAKMSSSEFCDTLISHSKLIGTLARDCKWTKTYLLYSRVEGAQLDTTKTSLGANSLVGTNIGEARKV